MTSHNLNLVRKKVLVVDDDQTVLLLAEDALAAEGFEVRLFANPCEAMEAVQKQFPDIIVLDVVMAGLDGFEFCAWLRKLPGGQDIPVLMMTASEDRNAIHRAFEVGATNFTLKPVNWVVEAHRLRYLLRSTDLAQELRHREIETRLANEDWALTFNSFGDVVTVLSPDLRIQRANAAAVKALKKPLQEILGCHCYELFVDRSQACVNCPVVRARENLAQESGEIRYTHPEMDRLVTGSPATDENGQLLRLVHVARDLSEQKRLEAAYRQAQKMEAIGTLAGGIAHEFNNLLHVIQGYAELLAAADEAEGRLDSDAHQIIRAAKRGGALTRQMLVFSRKAGWKGEKKVTNITFVIQEVLKILERTLPKTVSIRTQFGKSLPAIIADENHVQQVMMNLCVNAAQAMGGGGLITIETQRATLGPEYCRLHPEAQAGDYILVSVSDTGCGMDRATMARIYEPFFTTKGVGQGTGLGLAVVYGIVKEHAGHIACESEPNKGTTFQVYFPISEQELGQLLPQMAQAAAPWRGTELIMVVDDEETIGKLVKRCLAKAGYSVITARDGAAALELYQKAEPRPSMTIMDLGMAGMGGLECLEKLRQMDPKAQVLVATGYGDEENKARAFEMGAAGFVTKPYEIAELYQKIRTVLDHERKVGS